ncbi:LPXTG cell wall anchor domain-containing protein [Plantibacter flavus]|uniref:LPXTG cell wall anchor domain-containing protein n=1 Tax=Plantibacter flavus TaxID=150123 RepID=UPI0033931E48
MSRHLSWRKALAVPAAIALALGGAVLTAAPASAAEAGLTVTAPAQNSTVDSRTVTVTGSVLGGSTVIVYAADGTTPLARTNVGGSFGQPIDYSVQLPTYADDAAVAQNIKVGGLFGGSGIPQVGVDFSLPAVAPAFAVTSPTEGQALDSRTVTFTGTGTDGSTVNVLDTNGDRVPGTTAAVVTNGQWTTTGTYADDAAVAQTVNVNQVTGGAGRGEATVNFTLPAAVPAQTFSVTSPTEGQALDSRTVTFTGTGTDGSTVNVLDTNGDRVPGTTAAVVTNGQWTTTGTYADDAAVAQTVNVNQVTGGAGRGEQTVNFTLPTNTVLGAPSITSPTEGETVVGDVVTFTGTGEPGAYIGLLTVPTAALDEVSANARAAAEPADPADEILVDENGQWSVTLAFAPNAYTTVAIQSTVPAPTEVDQISAPSEPVSFTLAAAPAAAAPGAATPPAANAGNTLASTGVDGTAFLGLSALLMLGGAALLVVRKRRAQLS